MFKDKALGTKIGIGFGVLIILVAILGGFNWRGSSRVSAMFELVDKGSDIIDYVSKCGALRRDFQAKGFAKAAGEEKTSADKWRDAYGQLATALETLKTSYNLSAKQSDLVNTAVSQTAPYKTTFESLTAARQMKDDAFTAWSKIGWAFTDEIQKTQKATIEPSIQAAEASSNAVDIVKWAHIESDLDQKVFQNFLLLRVSAIYLMVTAADEQWTKFQDQLSKCSEGISSWSNLVKGNADLEAVAGKIGGLFNEYEATGKNYYEAILKDRKSVVEIATIGNAITEIIGKLQHLSEADMNSTMKMTNRLSALISILAVILGVILAIFITRSITKPINKVIDALTGGAEQVTSASGQVSSASQSLAQGASEQASSLEETSSALEEMASMTRQNADNANQANGAAKETNTMALEGVDSMKRMAEAIERIKNSASETAKIIKTIDEIAFQTNLLALNAAVEAARAGEAGKGFAVVAEEVRNLARRSAEAAKNTADLIEGAQKNAEAGVNVFDGSGEEPQRDPRQGGQGGHADRGDRGGLEGAVAGDRPGEHGRVRDGQGGPAERRQRGRIGQRVRGTLLAGAGTQRNGGRSERHRGRGRQERQRAEPVEYREPRRAETTGRGIGNPWLCAEEPRAHDGQASGRDGRPQSGNGETRGGQRSDSAG